jgi:hypothetical protein
MSAQSYHYRSLQHLLVVFGNQEAWMVHDGSALGGKVHSLSNERQPKRVHGSELKRESSNGTWSRARACQIYRQKGLSMSGLDFFAIIVLFILLLAAAAIWVALAMLPGKIAKSRNHAQADAINVGGWLGALLMGIFWPLALIWAFSKPRQSDEIAQLQARIEALEAGNTNGGEQS